MTPESILKLRPSRMRTLGLSTQKTAYIRDLARHTRAGTVVFEDLPALPDEEVIVRLTQVKGIGVWTAHMFLIFALQRTDVLPDGRSGHPQRDSQGLRSGSAAHPRRNGADGAPLASLLLGRELVPLAKPGRRRQPVASDEPESFNFHDPLKITALVSIIGSGY